MSNTSECIWNGTFASTNTRKCHILRGDWKYVEDRYFSFEIQYDLPCDEKWLIPLVSSIFYLGMGVGSIVLGWISDNYGRKKAIVPSIGFSLFFGFLGPYLPSIRSLIFVRFLVGFFYPGAIVQVRSCIQSIAFLDELIIMLKGGFTKDVWQIRFVTRCCFLVVVIRVQKSKFSEVFGVSMKKGK